jgi:Zn-dependent protease/CBS domain-containing protein
VLRGNLKIGRIFGIPVEINVSWILILVLVSWTVAYNYFPEGKYGYLSGLHRWLLGAAAALMLFGSILLHELMHSVVAVRNGLPVKRITLFLFGGVAQMSDEPRTAGVEFKMAIAGPLTSLVLGVMFAGIYYLFYHTKGGSSSVAAMLFYYVALINFLILIFNMVPGFPLDGGRVLRSIIWGITGNITKATYVTSLIGKAFAILLIFGGLVNLVRGDPISGVWFVFIGFFLHQAADSGYYQVLVRRGLEGHEIREVMQRDVVTIEAGTPVGTAVHDYFLRYRYNSFPVLENGRLVGMLTTHDLKTIPREEWDTRAVREIMETEPVEHALSPHEHAYKALIKIAEDGRGRLPVVEEGEVVGIVSNRDIMKLLKFKMDMG